MKSMGSVSRHPGVPSRILRPGCGRRWSARRSSVSLVLRSSAFRGARKRDRSGSRRQGGEAGREEGEENRHGNVNDGSVIASSRPRNGGNNHSTLPQAPIVYKTAFPPTFSSGAPEKCRPPCGGTAFGDVGFAGCDSRPRHNENRAGRRAAGPVGPVRVLFGSSGRSRKFRKCHEPRISGPRSSGAAEDRRSPVGLSRRRGRPRRPTGPWCRGPRPASTTGPSRCGPGTRRSGRRCRWTPRPTGWPCTSSYRR